MVPSSGAALWPGMDVSSGFLAGGSMGVSGTARKRKRREVQVEYRAVEAWMCGGL